MITEREKGWLAGFIDGEGCVFAWRSKKGAQAISVSLNITNGDWRAMEKCARLLNQITGFHIPVKLVSRAGRSHWFICLTKKQILLALLPVLLKDLTVVKAQAAHALELVKHNGYYWRSGRPSWPEHFYNKIRFFNSHVQEPNGTWRLGKKGQGSRGVQTG